MKLELTFYGALCATSCFKINDIEASSIDFGEHYDHNSYSAPEYGCGNMKFTGNRPTQSILNKYSITLDEYNEICDKLEKGLSFGRCGWCI